jgi:hypothetical protein
MDQSVNFSALRGGHHSVTTYMYTGALMEACTGTIQAWIPWVFNPHHQIIMNVYRKRAQCPPQRMIPELLSDQWPEKRGDRCRPA